MRLPRILSPDLGYFKEEVKMIDGPGQTIPSQQMSPLREVGCHRVKV